MRSLSPALALVLAGTLTWAPLGAAEGDLVPLTAVSYDTVWLTNGSQLNGTILGTQSDGAVRLERIGQPVTVIPKNEYLRIERKQTLPEAIVRRGNQGIAAKDWTDVQATLRFALKLQADPKADPKKGGIDPQPAKDAAIEIANKALATTPTTEIAEMAILLQWDKQDLAGVVAAAQAGLSADPNWTPGYEYQAKVYLQQKQDDQMQKLVTAWIAHQPTAFQPNRYLAGMAEAAGDLKVATEAYRKGYALHQDWESALGYARCSLRRGDREEAAKAAKALIDNQKFTEAAHVWLGSAILSLGTPEADRPAQTHLEQGLAGNLDQTTADVAHYNLGLIQLRAGLIEDARKQFGQVQGPMGAVAMAYLEHKPLNKDTLPKGLAAFCADYNACIDLDNKNWQGVLGGNLDLTSSKRAVFLGQVAALLKSNGSDDAVHNLTATPGDESLRWQVYGLMLQGRFKDAEVVLDKLPVSDGWAIATRVYIAASRKDDAAARTWLKRLDNAVDTPRTYSQILIAEFASANDEISSEGFDWPDQEVVAVGWEVSAPGTNITAKAKNSKLIISGTQNGSEPTYVYKLEAADRLQSIEARFEIAGLAGATGGLEIADESRENGLQVGFASGKVVWRSAEKSVWGPWALTGLSTGADQAGLQISLDKGRLTVAVSDNLGNRVPVNANLGRGDRLAVGLFGSAEPGTTWTLGVDDFVIHRRPVARR
jgi:tetratricopeptide (TPR) repeat protein